MASQDPSKREGAPRQPLLRAKPLDESVEPRAPEFPATQPSPAHQPPAPTTAAAAPAPINPAHAAPPPSPPASAADPARRPASSQAGKAPAVPAKPVTPVEKPQDVFDAVMQNAPSWVVSGVLHLVVLLLMGLIAATAQHVATNLDVAARYVEPEGPEMDQIGAQQEDPLAPGDGFSRNEGPGDDKFLGPELDDALLVTDSLIGGNDNPFESATRLDHLVFGSGPERIDVPSVAGMFDLRGKVGLNPGGEGGPLAKYGGSPKTEAAVQEGLKWLARNQHKDGMWSLSGPFQNGVMRDNNAAATAMALLAFQGNGHTHQSGDYKDNVARGVQALLRNQKSDGDFFYRSERSADWLYTHAQCTIAICELYAMTKDPALREPAERAVRFCVESQAPEGGWKYVPRHNSDTSVTGWMVMALKSAQMGGIEVPSPVFEGVSTFLDKVGSDQMSRYGYEIDSSQGASLAMTAEALLCRQYLGWDRNHPSLLRGAGHLLDNLPDNKSRDVYYWYYATQVMHHMQGDDFWVPWNEAMKKALLETQEQNGPEKGSWHPEGKYPDRWGMLNFGGGRLYTTCLSIYMLEVYYRHMPLYQHMSTSYSPVPPTANKY